MNILFICHGNICRSQMAQMMMLDKINKYNLININVESMAVSSEEIGNTIYPKARRCLETHNIEVIEHFARKISYNDYNSFDIILCMDNSNLRRLEMIHRDNDNKYKLLLSYINDEEVSDPWYTGDFEKCYYDIDRGLEAFIKKEILNK